MNLSSIFLRGAASIALFLIACVFFAQRQDPVVPGREGVFPHGIHVGDEVALDCVDCHDSVETAAVAGMPTLNLCLACHDEEEESSLPLSSQMVGFILPGDEQATWSAVTSSPLDLTFSHLSHGDGGVDCEACHEGVSEAAQTSWDWSVPMDSCLACHEQEAVGPLECEQCHEDLGVDDSPANHATDWQLLHGMFSSVDDLHDSIPARNCTLCHTRESCDTCHRTTRPLSHTEPWRRRGHGFAADINRESCATCHTEASCVRCHQTSVPSNHGGIWGGTTSAHCVACHIPLDGGDSCSVCHQATPSHNRAPLRLGPPHPGPSSDCNSCHVPLNHLDNGQNCSTCHH